MQRFSAALLACAMLATTACGRDNDRVAVGDTGMNAAGGAYGGTAAGTIEGNMRVTDVTLGRAVGADNRISDETDDFRPTDAIVAVVETDGAANGQSIVARWTFEDGQVVQEQTQTVSSTGGRSLTQFRLTRPTAWPEGKYRLSVLVNNNEVESEEFEVKRD